MTETKHPLRRLWNYSRGFQKRIILASLGSILNKIFDLAPPALIGMAVDVIVQQEDSLIASFGYRDPGTQLVVLAVLTLIIWGFESLFQYFYAVLWRGLAQELQHQLRVDAYGHVQSLELSYFEDRSTGGLMSILNDDINQLERFLDVGANDILQVITTVTVIGGIFFGVAPTVAWMAVLPMPLIIWGSIRFQRLLAPRYARVRELVGRLNGQLSNNLSGIATIKSFTAEDYEIRRIERESERYRESNQQAIKLSSAFVPLIRMVIVSGFIAILIFGGRLALAGEIEVGAYSVLVFITQRLLWPLTRLGDTLDLYQRAMASINRIFNLLDAEQKIPAGNLRLLASEVKGEIKFDGVSFEYENGQGDSVLKELNLTIREGQTVGIVGSTGAGKSTLVKLLLRFYDVQEGVITLDDLDITGIRLEDLRKAVGFVSQDVFLFHGTILENITYGTFDADFDRVVHAARVAEAHSFIAEFPDGYQTMVGERGQKLSGGQRQRISLARAVLKNPPVLILDEATSSVDNETEALIQRSLERITRDRTTLVIAHRLSTVVNADRIFVLDRGRLCEQGTHQQLLQNQGIYADLWAVQTGAALKNGGGFANFSPEG
ncbi:MAG: ABC transporter ATP-binding protein [Anaerolineales bacterium]|nr:ABC transporter ATP-binding protein [Anaerolineales bacterium]